jgi:mono/diheme cytochrome c family protein
MMLCNLAFAGEAKKEDPHKVLFETKCSQCHAADKINEAHRSKEDLKKILGRMTSKPGCNINAKEAQEIELYLLGDMGPAGAPGM